MTDDPVGTAILVYLILQSPLILYAARFAPKLGARRWEWVVLAAIPWAGLAIGYVLALRAFGAALDALEERDQFMRIANFKRQLGKAAF